MEGESGHVLVSLRRSPVTVSKARGTGTVLHLSDAKLRCHRDNNWGEQTLRPFLRRIWVPWIDAPGHNLWFLQCDQPSGGDIERDPLRECADCGVLQEFAETVLATSSS